MLLASGTGAEKGEPTNHPQKPSMRRIDVPIDVLPDLQQQDTLAVRARLLPCRPFPVRGRVRWLVESLPGGDSVGRPERVGDQPVGRVACLGHARIGGVGLETRVVEVFGGGVGER